MTPKPADAAARTMRIEAGAFVAGGAISSTATQVISANMAVACPLGKLRKSM